MKVAIDEIFQGHLIQNEKLSIEVLGQAEKSDIVPKKYQCYSIVCSVQYMCILNYKQKQCPFIVIIPRFKILLAMISCIKNYFTFVINEKNYTNSKVSFVIVMQKETLLSKLSTRYSKK